MVVVRESFAKVIIVMPLPVSSGGRRPGPSLEPIANVTCFLQERFPWAWHKNKEMKRRMRTENME